MNKKITKAQLEEMIASKLSHFFGVTPKDATDDQFYRALAIIVRDMVRDSRRELDKLTNEKGQKRIYYLCMEFLMGRTLKNTLYNLNLTETAKGALASFGIKLDKLYDCEPDAGLGNGGLGRLAACYLDALANQGYNGMGYSILYEYGIFKQKIIDGWQTEMPDFWLPGGEVWLVPREDKTVEVKFEGEIVDSWDGPFHQVEMVNCKSVKAVPYDMMVAGKDGKGAAVLRLWSAKVDGINMAMFNQGDYINANLDSALSANITRVLYPNDNNYEGKELRLKQQYFLVSATVQDIIARIKEMGGDIRDFPKYAVIQLNDTHPALQFPN